MKRSTIIMVGVGGLVGIGSGVAWRLAGAESELELHIPRVDIATLSTPHSPFSASHDEVIVWLYNDVGRRENWRAKDRERVLDILSAWSPQDISLNTMTPAEFEEWDTLGTLLAILGDRLRFGGKIETEVAIAWRNQVIDLLGHRQPHARQEGVGTAGNSGMLYMPDIRAMVENLAASDPNGNVRHIAHLKLAQHDGRDPGVVPCATCPGGVSP